MPHPEILSIRAAIYVYQKEFYVWSTDQRGTDALQELVLEFESGVFCVGRAFRIPLVDQKPQFARIWTSEMVQVHFILSEFN